MSRIDQLIEELCPDGVKHEPISKVGTFIRGGGPQKKDFTDVGVGCIHYGQIYTYYGISAIETNVFVSDDVALKSRKASPGDVVIAVTSGNDEDLGKSVAWLGESPVAVSNHTLIFTSDLDSRFISYFLSSTSFHRQKQRFITGTKVRALPESAFGKIFIPVPPLPVQQEIVRILDLFTQLEAELEAELEARRKQFEHYRRLLLESDDSNEQVELGNIAEYVNGKAHERLVTPDGTIPLVTARFVSRDGQANRFVGIDDVKTPVLADDIAMVLSDLPKGRALARTFYIENDGGYAINQRVARIRVLDRERVFPRYLAYVLDRNKALLRYDNGFDQTHLSKAQVTGLKLSFPPRDTQIRVAAILDRFVAMVNSLDSGLPAEISARRKQYEYYRDKLLTFKELSA